MVELEQHEVLLYHTRSRDTWLLDQESFTLLRLIWEGEASYPQCCTQLERECAATRLDEINVLAYLEHLEKSGLVAHCVDYKRD